MDHFPSEALGYPLQWRLLAALDIAHQLAVIEQPIRVDIIPNRVARFHFMLAIAELAPFPDA